MSNRDPLDIRFDELPGDPGPSRRDPKTDPLAVRFEASANPVDPVRLDIELQPWLYPKDMARAIDYVVEYRRSTNSELMRSVDRDVFLRELGLGTEVSAALLKGAIRAFLAAALGGPHARTHEGWHAVIAALRKVLGNAVSMGITDARLAGMRVPQPPPMTPRVPPVAPWAIMAYEARRPTQEEMAADLAYWQGLPVRLVETLLRGHVAARFQTEEGATAEGRSRILASVRDDLWDAMLDAVKRCPCPQATPPPPPGRKMRPRR